MKKLNREGRRTVILIALAVIEVGVWWYLNAHTSTSIN
jgi:hypothetical protein